MARALDQIMAELESVYSPQKDVYNQKLSALPGQQQAELGGLEAAKTDSFNQITQGANRRGVAFGGIPLAEQASYLGQSYLPAVANLKGKFAGLKSDLSLRLAELAAKQRQDAYGIRDYELQEDARREAAAQAARAASSGGGGGGGFSFGGFGGAGETTSQAGAAPQLSLRQQWQQEANAGDWNAQVALNYAGDDGRYDGVVNSQAEYDILKNMGIQGNYYVAKKKVNVPSAPSGSVPSASQLQAEAMRRAASQYGLGNIW